MPTFLIADDSLEKTTMLHHFLHAAKWTGELVTANTCEGAYRLIEEKPDITAAFINYYIPKENGPAIIRRLRTKYPDCLIALVSSADSEKNAKEARDAGADAVLCTTRRSDETEHDVLALLSEWKETLLARRLNLP